MCRLGFSRVNTYFVQTIIFNNLAVIGSCIMGNMETMWEKISPRSEESGLTTAQQSVGMGSGFKGRNLMGLDIHSLLVRQPMHLLL